MALETTDALQNDVGSYRAWVSMLVSGLMDRGLQVNVREARNGCVDSFANHTKMENATWADFVRVFKEVHAAGAGGIVFLPSDQLANRSLEPPSTRDEQMDQVEVLQLAGVHALDLVQRWLPAMPMAIAGGMGKRAGLGGAMTSATLSVLSQALPAQAGPGACVGCFVACCGGTALLGACMYLAWNPAGFLACAAAGCGGYCSAFCAAVCIAPTP